MQALSHDRTGFQVKGSGNPLSQEVHPAWREDGKVLRKTLSTASCAKEGSLRVDSYLPKQKGDALGIQQ